MPSISPKEDLLYLHSRKEAAIILVVWLGCLLFTVSYCYLHGYLNHNPGPGTTGPDLAELLGPLDSYNRVPASLQTPLGLGIPDWVFYGVLLPWLACLVFTCWFCTFFFAEDDLEDSQDKDTTDV